ncbi:MAG: acylphosphatase [Flavobacteriaceae bacterium]|nr:acylphosphatase [Flavobacteriaceae bacterium]
MTIKITVKGKVQGVFFRNSTKEQADSLKIRGTVENLSNGDVLIVAQGKEENLNKLINWSRQGPERAVVDSVQFEEIEDSNFLKNFIVKRW